MSLIRKLIFTVLLSQLAVCVLTKIVLPHNLRYLENMLNADVIAKAAKIRQRLEANPNAQDGDKGWPMLLAKYEDDNKNSKLMSKSKYAYYNKRYDNFF